MGWALLIVVIKKAAKWDERRLELLARLRQLRQAQGLAQTETARQVEQIRLIGDEMNAVAAQAKDKDALLQQLKRECVVSPPAWGRPAHLGRHHDLMNFFFFFLRRRYEEMPKDVTRSACTRRSMEIVRSIHKQEAVIKQVLVDTRVVQKDINALAEKLERTFFVTDELVFRDAKKDENARTAYKQLASLHEVGFRRQ